MARVAPVDAVVSPPCSQILLGYPLARPAAFFTILFCLVWRGAAVTEHGLGEAVLRIAPLAHLPRVACTPGGFARPLPPTPHARSPQVLLPQVKGSTDTVQLLKLLRPKVYIPLLK